MDSEQNARVDHFLSGLGEAGEETLRVGRLRRDRFDGEAYIVSCEELLEHARKGSRQTICTRNVVRVRRVHWVRRGHRERRKICNPAGLGLCSRIAVEGSVLNCHTGSPEVVKVLGVPDSHTGVGTGNVGEGEEPGAVADVVDIVDGNSP